MTDTMPQVRAGRNAAEVQAASGDTPARGDTAARRVLSEATLTLDAGCIEAGKLRGGVAVSRRTLTEWITVGFRRSDGRRVHLDGIKVGSRWVTSREAITRFIEACQGS